MRAMAVDVPRLFASRRVQWVFIAASVLGLIIGIDTLILHLRLDPLADVRAYYDAGARLNAGLPLYVQTATTDDPGFYRYPPLLAIAFRPLALLPYESAALIWEAFLIVLFAGTLVRLGLRNRWTWIVSGWLAAPIAFIGFSDLGQVGNVENRSLYAISPLLWVAFVIGLLALAVRFAPTKAGWSLAVAASVLISPRLLLYQLSTLQAAVRAPDQPDGEPT
jgi:hypothetical protein